LELPYRADITQTREKWMPGRFFRSGRYCTPARRPSKAALPRLLASSATRLPPVDRIQPAGLDLSPAFARGAHRLGVVAVEQVADAGERGHRRRVGRGPVDQEQDLGVIGAVEIGGQPD